MRDDAEARHLAQLEHTGRERGPQSLELLATARLVELADRRGQRRTDAGDLGEAVLGDERPEIGRERLQRPGPALVRAGLERIPTLDLEEESDLAQQSGDRQAIHVSQLTAGAFRQAGAAASALPGATAIQQAPQPQPGRGRDVGFEHGPHRPRDNSGGPFSVLRSAARWCRRLAGGGRLHGPAPLFELTPGTR